MDEDDDERQSESNTTEPNNNWTNLLAYRLIVPCARSTELTVRASSSR